MRTINGQPDQFNPQSRYDTHFPLSFVPHRLPLSQLVATIVPTHPENLANRKLVLIVEQVPHSFQ
jgi:hypothetical protein